MVVVVSDEFEKEKEEFEIGDYVYIIRGKDKLESGAIYKINDDTGEVELIKVGFNKDYQYYPNGGIERIKYKRYNLNPLSKTNIIKTFSFYYQIDWICRLLCN